MLIEEKYNCIREMLEDDERKTLSPYASLSCETKGRDKREKMCDIRPEYQRDRDRILHSKSFRRLKMKTQVFLAPEGDHYRTRLTHTLEVSQIARTISKALHLNLDLTEAIALGHDLGHTPFGHSGEKVLNELCSAGFEHSEQSIRVVEILEKNGKGLNLTKEVRDGIRNHQTSGRPSTLEGCVVRLSDKIAYINHDVDDSIRAGLITEADIPSEYSNILGHSANERLNNIIHDVIINSFEKDAIVQNETYAVTMAKLREWMFENIYTSSSQAKAEESKAQNMIRLLFEYYMKNPDKMTSEYKDLIIRGDSRERAVCDYISGMTDTYAIEKFEELFVPVGWRN